MAGCSDEGPGGTPPDDQKPRLTVITSMGGLGDMGYNDLIMAGIMRFYEKNDVRMSLIRAADTADARRAIDTWLAEGGGGAQSLLVLAEDSYAEPLRDRDVSLAPNRRILIFESDGDDLPQGVTSFAIDRYGAAWLAGRMCSEHTSATVLAAMPGNSTLNAAIEGFSDGYADGGGGQAGVMYLADGPEGFDMADSAYRMTGQLDSTVILPLAGGSNNGVYKQAREVFSLAMVIGMDADCSLRCQNVPYSIVVKIDSLAERYLTAWLNGSMAAGHATYGLESGVTDIVTSPYFYTDTDYMEEYYATDPDYWNKARAAHKDEAIRKEREHDTDK